MHSDNFLKNSKTITINTKPTEELNVPLESKSSSWKKVKYSSYKNTTIVDADDEIVRNQNSKQLLRKFAYETKGGSGQGVSENDRGKGTIVKPKNPTYKNLRHK